MLVYDVCVCVFCVCTINCPLLRLFCGNRDVTRTNVITISRSLSKLIIMCLFWQSFKLVCTENYFRIYTHKTDTKVIDRLTEISILLCMFNYFFGFNNVNQQNNTNWLNALWKAVKNHSKSEIETEERILFQAKWVGLQLTAITPYYHVI